MAGAACGAGSVRGASACRLCCNGSPVQIASALRTAFPLLGSRCKHQRVIILSHCVHHAPPFDLRSPNLPGFPAQTRRLLVCEPVLLCCLRDRMPRRVSDGAQDRQRDEVADAPRATEGQPDVVQGLSAPITRRNSARDCSPVGPSECTPLTTSVAHEPGASYAMCAITVTTSTQRACASLPLLLPLVFAALFLN